MKTTLQIVLLLMVFITPAFAQAMLVKMVQGNVAVIEDKASGQEWQVREGDIIGDGWKVVTITDTLVTIEKQSGPKKRVRVQMPVRGETKPIDSAR